MLPTKHLKSYPDKGKERIRGLQFFFILLFCLSTIQFFEPVFINPKMLFYSYLGLFLLVVFLIFTNYKSSLNNYFTLPIFLILISEAASIFSASYSWNQDLYDSFKGTVLYMSYILFFLLVILKFRKIEINYVIVLMGGIYMFVFLVAFLFYPRILFGINETYGAERGFQRIMVNGIGFLFLMSFYSLGQYLHKRQIAWLTIYIATMVFIIMSLTRTYIIFSFLLSFIYLFQKSRSIYRFAGIIVVGLCLYAITQLDFYKLLAQKTSTQTAEIKDDIRLQSAIYYLNDFSPNVVSKFLGNGIPFAGSKYGDYVKYVEDVFGYFTSDIGYIGFYMIFGGMAILAYLILIYKTIKIRVDEEYLYCKYFLYFIFIISVIIDAPFNKSFIPSIMIAVYVLATNSQKGNHQKSDWPYSITPTQ